MIHSLMRRVSSTAGGAQLAAGSPKRSRLRFFGGNNSGDPAGRLVTYTATTTEDPVTGAGTQTQTGVQSIVKYGCYLVRSAPDLALLADLFVLYVGQEIVISGTLAQQAWFAGTRDGVGMNVTVVEEYDD